MGKEAQASHPAEAGIEAPQRSQPLSGGSTRDPLTSPACTQSLQG